MITDDDVKKLLYAFGSVFTTKEDLEKTIFEAKEEFKGRFDDVMTKMDHIYGEVLKMRQEQTVHGQRHDDIERIPIIAHHLKHHS